MALDLSTATEWEINNELGKYSLNRKRLAYEIAIEDVLSIGQENWDGDKKHYEARLDFLQSGLKEIQKQISLSKQKCTIKTCNVEFI